MASYKIKDIEILTGIKAHTIRIWESRYGILHPERSDTQIRMYTDEDLVCLLGIRMLNQHGIKISRIAEMTPEEMKKTIQAVHAKKEVNASIEDLIMALVEMDEQIFRNTLTKLIELHGLENAFIQHLIPFLDRIGVMWLTGTINPAQEHFISSLIRQKIIREIDALPIPDPNVSPVLLYLPEHEWHEISLLFYHFLLRNAGIHTVYLGQSLPYESLLICIDKVQPHSILSSWLTSVDEKFICDYHKQLRKKYPELAIYCGGAQIGIHLKKIETLVHPILNTTSMISVIKSRHSQFSLVQ
jgi:DNA-binding transcriptional MerR regulator